MSNPKAPTNSAGSPSRKEHDEELQVDEHPGQSVEKPENNWKSTCSRIWSALTRDEIDMKVKEKYYKIYLIVWLTAVLTDPLFLYLPILDDDKKCLRIDKNLMIVALVLRSITDLFDIFHNILRLVEHWNDNLFKVLCRDFDRDQLRLWFLCAMNILALLPVPQAVTLYSFSKTIPGFGLFSKGKFGFNISLLLHYASRYFRLYRTYEEFKESMGNRTQSSWVRGAFMFSLYIICSHTLGAFWYFFSVQQGMECWYHACKNQTGCLPAAFNCSNVDIPSRNLTFVNDFCPINPPNATVFDFGIYLGALQSGIIGSTDFPKKLLLCVGWGLRNLSSFGSNLQTSPNPWETLFADFISVLGLLLFLFLIGHVQLYVQFAAERSERRRREREEKKEITEREMYDNFYCDNFINDWMTNNNIDDNFKVKLELIVYEFMNDANQKDDFESTNLKRRLQKYLPKDVQNMDPVIEPIVNRVRSLIESRKGKTETQAEIWMEENKIEERMQSVIKHYVKHRLNNSKEDVNLVNLLSVFPSHLHISIKEHLCLGILKKAPMLRTEDDSVVQEIVNHLEPVVYEKRSYVIREGEPLDFVLLITRGIACEFRISPSSGNGEAKTATHNERRYLKEGDIFGEELLENFTGGHDLLNLASPNNVICHMRIEGFAISAIDLQEMYDTTSIIQLEQGIQEPGISREVLDHGSQADALPVLRPKRERKQPAWTKDYVVYK